MFVSVQFSQLCSFVSVSTVVTGDVTVWEKKCIVSVANSVVQLWLLYDTVPSTVDYLVC